MGLDIYFHIVKKTNVKNFNNESVDEAYQRIKKNGKRKFSDWADKTYKKLEDADKKGGNEYRSAYFNEFADMLYLWFQNKFMYNNMCDGVHPLSEVKKWLDEQKKYYCIVEDAYFRKVNFVYKYFSDRLQDECCFAYWNDIVNLRILCEEVSKNHKLADKLLPTVEGFFFGSTEYDNWYFRDIEDCAIQMEKLIMRMDRDDKVIVIMSW